MVNYLPLICLLFLFSCFSENIEKPFCANKSKIQTKLADSINTTQINFNNQIDSNQNIKEGYNLKLKDGSVKKTNNYANGVLHGEQIEYYKNGIRSKENFHLGKKEGYQFFYYEGKTEIKLISFYRNDSNLWVGFPFANEKFIIPIKDFHIHADSIYVIAPFNNGNTWYEGSFVNYGRKSSTGKRVGIHKVYFTNGNLKAIVNFDIKRITEYDSFGNVLRNNDTFDKGITLPTNYKK